MTSFNPSAETVQRIANLNKLVHLDDVRAERVRDKAMAWIEHIQGNSGNLFTGMLTQFGLNSREGLSLLALAECFLRIPDEETALDFARSMLRQGRWNDDFFNSATWSQWMAEAALKWGKIYFRQGEKNAPWLLPWTNPLFLRTVRLVIHRAAQQFVFADTPDQALQQRDRDMLYTFDMLGEAALGAEDVDHYLNQYGAAILALANKPRNVHDSVSIKLSALHPHFKAGKEAVCLPELVERVLWLARTAAQHNIALTLDAEDSETQSLGLSILRSVRRHPDLASWDGLGIAVQAYLHTALDTLAELDVMARQTGLSIPVRLVKGAYWDQEIKRAQQLGLASYPVHIRKSHTDLAYLACAQRLLDSRFLRPQFASHNAHSLAWIHEIADGRPYEVQKLHGMGDALHLLHAAETGIPCRTYAPVGAYEALLPYLVRRLMENASSQSFVALVHDQERSQALAEPFQNLDQELTLLQDHDCDPRSLPGLNWQRAHGHSLADHAWLLRLEAALNNLDEPSPCCSIVHGTEVEGNAHPHHSRADGRFMCHLHLADSATSARAMALAAQAVPDWRDRPLEQRVDCLLRMSDRIEAHATDYLSLLVHEGGKVIADAESELREAVELLRYYAHLALDHLSPVDLPSVTGERNSLYWQGRGVFLCISPWNFPLAILLGQIGAALVSGNCVVAKPALQTPMLAARAVRDLHACGVPVSVLHLIVGSSSEIGTSLLEAPHLAGVALTGSTTTARLVQIQLASKHEAILPLIAETGGLNAMIADSTTLIQQLIKDIVVSAFNSAGQRCSSCRVLFIQDSLLPALRQNLPQAMHELILGNPMLPETDIGPVIDLSAQSMLLTYLQDLESRAECIARAECPQDGCFVAPSAFLCRWEDLPDREIFGPVLHIALYRRGEEDRVLHWIRSSGYGLTLGLHSRMPQVWIDRARTLGVGNIYVNRNQIGAQVACQPFGGQGLSGTGFKAGGPNYLYRFAQEQVVAENMTALGINPDLASTHYFSENQ